MPANRSLTPQDKIFVRGNAMEPESLDPHKTSGQYESHILWDLFEPLLQYDAEAHPIVGVASSWTVSKDGKTYTFHLRKNARWSNGEPVTAHDFVYAWRRMLDPSIASRFVGMLSLVKKGKALAEGSEKDLTKLGVVDSDDYTFVVTLEHPAPHFLKMLPHSALVSLHRASIEKHGMAWTKPENIVSNGAFVMKEWVTQSHMLLHKNPFYWDRDHVSLADVQYVPIDDRSSEYRRFQSGELHVTAVLPPRSCQTSEI